MRLALLIPAGVAAFGLCAAARAALVDFSDALTDNFDAVQLHQGFVWAFSAEGWFVGPHDVAVCPSCTSNGSANLLAAGSSSGATARVTMSPAGGGAFDLLGLDAATANSTENNLLDVIGTFAGGGTISATLPIDASFDSYPLTGFSGLSSVLFVSRAGGAYNFGGFSLDNLVLGPPRMIPAPAGAGLAALALLAGPARRRFSAASARAGK